MSLPVQHPIPEVCQLVFFKACQSLCGGNPDSLPGKKRGILPIIPWESISCDDKYTIIQVWKKKRFPHNIFRCLYLVVMCKGWALCGRNIILCGKDIISRSRSFWRKEQNLPSLVLTYIRQSWNRVASSRVYKVKQLPTFYMTVKTRRVC